MKLIMCRFPAPANCSIDFDGDSDGPEWMWWWQLKLVLYVTTGRRDLDRRDLGRDPDQYLGPNLNPYHRHRTSPSTNDVDRLQKLIFNIDFLFFVQSMIIIIIICAYRNEIMIHEHKWTAWILIIPFFASASSFHLSIDRRRAFMKKFPTVVGSKPSCRAIVTCISLDGLFVSYFRDYFHPYYICSSSCSQMKLHG